MTFDVNPEFGGKPETRPRRTSLNKTDVIIITTKMMRSCLEAAVMTLAARGRGHRVPHCRLKDIFSIGLRQFMTP